jgi:hypothetical protein
MDPGISSSQATPSRRGWRRRSSSISIRQIDSNTYKKNWRIHRASMNAATNPNTLGATHESAEPSTHEQPSSAGSSDGTILMLVPSFCYW